MHFLMEAFGMVLLALQSGHNGGGYWGPWMLIPFLLWIGLLALVARLLRRLFPRRRSGGREEAQPLRDSAEEILRERFARGEVSEGEYLRALGILRGDIPENVRGTDVRRERGDEGYQR